MAASDALMGYGMPPSLAGLLGTDPNLLPAAGTTQATAATIKAHNTEMTATGSDGVILPSGAQIGTLFYVFNSSGSNGKVYVPVGQNLVTTSATLNGSLTMTTGQRAFFYKYKVNNWTYNLSA